MEKGAAVGAFELESVLMNKGVSPPVDPKALGAYYTDSQVADFLVEWAVQNAGDTVLDPSFGGGVFLRAAGKRLRQLGGHAGQQIFGVEFDAAVHAEMLAHLQREFAVAPHNLKRSDFFEVGPGSLPAVDVVVGNPPFIRYQRFSGDVRTRALARAAEQGLRLSELTSSWLPFLIYSIRFLKQGGRLAMVIPFEIGHASYARQVLQYLTEHFDTTTFLTFRRKLFADLNEDTLLLLASGRREQGGHGRFFIRDLEHAGALATVSASAAGRIKGARQLDSARIAAGEERLIESLIPGKARRLYQELRDHNHTARLGELADVGIGYVTGANHFFHLDPDTARDLDIPERFLRPCVRRGRAFTGLRLTDADWQQMSTAGQAGYLLELPARGDLPMPVKKYLASGQAAGVHRTFKCRTRTPWYRVPHVHRPDAFLTYMSGDWPRLVANDAGVVAPNTLHILRTQPEAKISGRQIAALWRTSLTQLSVEIEGHALGGGMLKLEPSEAERVLVPSLPANTDLEDFAAELDRIARTRGDSACNDAANERLLRRGLGLSVADIAILSSAAAELRTRRSTRNPAR
jgi:adenine-specific DNA-methyltransferase